MNNAELQKQVERLLDEVFEYEIVERYEGSEYQEIFDDMTPSDRFYTRMQKFMK